MERSKAGTKKRVPTESLLFQNTMLINITFKYFNGYGKTTMKCNLPKNKMDLNNPIMKKKHPPYTISEVSIKCLRFTMQRNAARVNSSTGEETLESRLGLATISGENGIVK